MLAQRQNLARGRTPGRDGLDGLPTSRTSDADTDLRVLLRDVQPGAPHMHDFHRCHPLPVDQSPKASVEGREKSKSDARAQRHQSTVPVEPSATMLTYRLTALQSSRGRPRRTPPVSPPASSLTTAERDAPKSSLTMVSRRRRVADLRFHFLAGAGFEPATSGVRGVRFSGGQSGAVSPHVARVWGNVTLLRFTVVSEIPWSLLGIRSETQRGS